jgi:hypothetical protein
MKSRRTTVTTVKNETRDAQPIFDKENRKWMIIGGVVLALGFILMAGGRSDDPNVFNKDEVYSTVRITVAPLVLLAGLIIEIIAIFRQPKRG